MLTNIFKINVKKTKTKTKTSINKNFVKVKSVMFAKQESHKSFSKKSKIYLNELLLNNKPKHRSTVKFELFQKPNYVRKKL